MNTQSYAPEESIGFMTITANRLLSCFLRRKLREENIDLTAEQWGVLILLRNKDGATQDDLACTCCVDKSSMSRVLALMEEKGLINRRLDPANARRKIISMSDKAHSLYEHSLRIAREVMDLALADVSAQDHAVCLKVLASVKKSLGKAD
jgi:DNA-binding MarR family transcriptional regulator